MRKGENEIDTCWRMTINLIKMYESRMTDKK
jgi:hypothetical protein